jgi:MoaA/NifB/PqqE/SkfB family radical SAM enzyme
MYNLQDVKHIHMELSSMCNARCPLCPRNFYGYPYTIGYTEANLSLAQLQALLSEDVVRQLDKILINGNYGDFVMNLETVEILTWLRTTNKHLKIEISTNGGARNTAFWQQLAQLDLDIMFCIDGLEDTHHIYRQDTTYQQVIKNATAYIEAGGRAVWHMTEFNHNAHQIAEAQQRAAQLNFNSFQLRPTVRNKGPVYNRQGQKIFKLGNMDFDRPDTVDANFANQLYQMNQSTPYQSHTQVPIVCEAKTNSSIYISSQGHVYPCCYLALDKTYSKFHSGVIELDRVQPLNESIPLFAQIEQTFDSNHQLTACQTFCGR